MIGKAIQFLKDERLWRILRRQWDSARVSIPASHGSKVLIIPCDPWSVVGSRGDQAMIIASIQDARRKHPECEIDIMTDSHDCDEDCRALGLNPIADWPMAIDRWFAAHAGEYCEVYIPGADVTDGVYGWPTACKMLVCYDLFTGVGVKVHYLGFSWSKTPNRMMKRVLGHLANALPLPVRDPVSYERLGRFTSHRPVVQVADAAFCLEPRESKRVKAHAEWVTRQKADGRKVVAVNVHTMFNDTETKSVAWEVAFVGTLKTVLAKRRDVQLLFLPHDNRPGRSDHAILVRLFQSMDAMRCYLVDEVMDADEIKALVGRCDGLIAGRMHISIAALGQGVPVCGLVYQGKFEGLWKFFGLNEQTLLEPKLFLTNRDEAVQKIDAYIENLEPEQASAKNNILKVLALSRKNFR